MNEDKLCATCGKHYSRESDFLTGTSRWRQCSQGHLWFNCHCGSTMMVKKGKYPWYSPEKMLSPEARGVFNSLGNLKSLPHVPTSIMQIQQVLFQPNVTPKEVARQLRHDPVMATQILQIADNIRFTRNPVNPKISSLEHAIVYIGFNPLSDLIMTAGLRNMPVSRESGLDAERFWAESFLVGTIAEHVMHRYRLPLTPDEVFLAGSLCNLGKLVAAFCFGPAAAKVFRAVVEPSKLSTWREAETLHAFPDHCILGEIAAMLWGFPEYILKANRRHHDLPGKPPPTVSLNELVAFANQMAHWVLLQPHRMEYDIVTAFGAKLNIAEAEIEELARELGDLKHQMDADPVFVIH